MRIERNLVSDVLPFGRLWYDEGNAIVSAVGYAMHSGRAHDAVICDAASNVIETHENKIEFEER